MHKQQGWQHAWEYYQAKLIQTLGRASQGVNWSWSQCIKSHHAQTSSGKGLPSHFWNRDIVRSIIPGLRRKRTGLLLSGPKFSFQMKVNFAFHLEIKFPESGGRVERHRIHVAHNPQKSSVKFPQSVMIWATMSSAGVGLLCFLKSTVNAAIYQEILEHFMLPSTDKFYGDTDFIFGTCPNCQRYQMLVQWPWCYCACLASKLVWPEPHRESMEYCQEEDERHQIQQCRWPEGRY